MTAICEQWPRFRVKVRRLAFLSLLEDCIH
jgi:hypothetical protein